MTDAMITALAITAALALGWRLGRPKPSGLTFHFGPSHIAVLSILDEGGTMTEEDIVQIASSGWQSRIEWMREDVPEILAYCAKAGVATRGADGWSITENGSKAVEAVLSSVAMQDERA